MRGIYVEVSSVYVSASLTPEGTLYWTGRAQGSAVLPVLNATATVEIEFDVSSAEIVHIIASTLIYASLYPLYLICIQDFAVATTTNLLPSVALQGHMEYLSYPAVLQGEIDNVRVELDQGYAFEVSQGQFTFDPTVTSCSDIALSI